LSVRPRQCRFVFSDYFLASCCVVGGLIWVVLLVSAATGSLGGLGDEELSTSRDAPVDLRWVRDYAATAPWFSSTSIKKMIF
jgi:hypothetical protein